MRAIIIPLTSILLVVGTTAATNGRDASVGFTTRGYRYDNQTCSAGFQTCFSSHLRTGWQNAAASSYCSQACGVFPPQSQVDRYSFW